MLWESPVWPAVWSFREARRGVVCRGTADVFIYSLKCSDLEVLLDEMKASKIKNKNYRRVGKWLALNNTHIHDIESHTISFFFPLIYWISFQEPLKCVLSCNVLSLSHILSSEAISSAFSSLHFLLQSRECRCKITYYFRSCVFLSDICWREDYRLYLERMLWGVSYLVSVAPLRDEGMLQSLN